MTMCVAHRTGDRPSLRLTQNFWTHEFACNCGELDPIPEPAEGYCQGAVCMNDPRFFELVVGLQKLRDKVGPPITIERGFSCWEYHSDIYERIGKPVVMRSAHLYGLGADVWIHGVHLTKNTTNRDMLRGFGFTGIGWNMGAGANKIHLDVMDRVAEWDYAG